jgi:hypothetical protein
MTIDPKDIKVSVAPMHTSAGTDYFVQIECDGRYITPHVYKQPGRAEYDVAFWKWIFGQGEKPDLLAVDANSIPEPKSDPHVVLALAACLRHAFMAGAGYGDLEKISDEDVKRWVEWSPPNKGPFLRVASALGNKELFA